MNITVNLDSHVWRNI